MNLVQLKMREAHFWPKMKFETISFQVLWQFFNPKGSLLRAGGRGVWGEFRPPRLEAEAKRQTAKEPEKISARTLLWPEAGFSSFFV